jgi:hypothetical protein
MRRGMSFMLTVLALMLNLGLSVALAQEPWPPEKSAQDGIEPTWWGHVLASRWEPGWVGWDPHLLAVWTFPYCHQQEYLGPGGYQDTCSSSHGCIGNWTWWLTYPESKLGVPRSWWILNPARWNISNYRARCWIN